MDNLNTYEQRVLFAASVKFDREVLVNMKRLGIITIDNFEKIISSMEYYQKFENITLAESWMGDTEMSCKTLSDTSANFPLDWTVYDHVQKTYQTVMQFVENEYKKNGIVDGMGKELVRNLFDYSELRYKVNKLFK